MTFSPLRFYSIGIEINLSKVNFWFRQSIHLFTRGQCLRAALLLAHSASFLNTKSNILSENYENAAQVNLHISKVNQLHNMTQQKHSQFATRFVIMELIRQMLRKLAQSTKNECQECRQPHHILVFKPIFDASTYLIIKVI